MRLLRSWARIAVVVGSLALPLSGCEDNKPKPLTPEQVRARVAGLLPARVRDRKGWAQDVQTAFAALGIEPSHSNLCAALAVTEQESTFNADPPVPGLGRIARGEIERRAERMHVPLLLVRGALQIESPDGRTWDTRIGAVRTERELSALFEELIDSVPLGRRLLANANPVRTGGPMQVSIDFAERLAADSDYPYPVDGSIRHEVFTRRGGMYFGIAHLLGYPAHYDRPIYRFADYNAGRYASRNAAFQKAVSVASERPLDLDGDVVRYAAADDGSSVGATESAVQALGPALEMDDAQISRALGRANRADFDKSELYTRVFALANRKSRHPLPRAVVPHIRLHSPKITRKLTTEWFATRVDGRYRSCMARAGRKG